MVNSSSSSLSLLALPAGEAIIDPEPAQDLIGQNAYNELKERLRERGLQPIELSQAVRHPMGIGGSAKALFSALIPLSFDGHPQILMTVLESDIPALLSVGFLEFLEAEISLPEDRLTMKKLDVTLRMNRLASGHRAILLCDRPGGDFPIPQDAQKQYGLSPANFNLDSEGSPGPSRYMKRSSGSSGVGSEAHSRSDRSHLQSIPVSAARGTCGTQVDQSFSPSAISALSRGDFCATTERDSQSVVHGDSRLFEPSCRETMASASISCDRDDGGIPAELLSSLGCRKDKESPVLREQEACGLRRQAGPLSAPSSKAGSQGKQVCHVDSVPTVQCSDFICSPRRSGLKGCNPESVQQQCCDDDPSGHDEPRSSPTCA